MAKSWRDHATAAVEAFQIDPVELNTPARRQAAAESLIQTCAGIAGAVALQPLPIADFALLLPLQTALILKIAQIYQVPLDWRRTQAIVGVTLTGLLAKRVAGAVAKLIPGGTLAAVPIAYGATLAMGKAAMMHFAGGGGADYKSLKRALTKGAKQPADTPLKSAAPDEQETPAAGD